MCPINLVNDHQILSPKNHDLVIPPSLNIPYTDHKPLANVHRINAPAVQSRNGLAQMPLAISLDLPQPHGQIVADRDYIIPDPLQVPHGAFVSQQHIPADPVVAVALPQHNGVVVAAGGQQELGGVEFHTLHVLGVSAEHRDGDVLVVDVCFPDPDGLVSAAGGQVPVLETPGDAFYLAFVAFQRENAFHARGVLVPDHDGTVEARRGQVRLAAAPFDLANRFRVGTVQAIH